MVLLGLSSSAARGDTLVRPCSARCRTISKVVRRDLTGRSSFIQYPLVDVNLIYPVLPDKRSAARSMLDDTSAGFASFTIRNGYSVLSTPKPRDSIRVSATEAGGPVIPNDRPLSVDRHHNHQTAVVSRRALGGDAPGRSPIITKLTLLQ